MLVTYHPNNYWKYNPLWVVMDGPEPTHDPPGGCEMCGAQDCVLTWVPPDELPARFVSSPGEWLCVLCRP